VSVSRRWVTFDCYGTLANWQAWCADTLGTIVGSDVDGLVRGYHKHERLAEREQPHRSYKDVLVTALTRAAADCGIRLARPEARVLVQAWPTMRLFADVEPMLAELRLRGYRLAVLTNCDDDLFASTHRLFEVPFDLFVTAERVRGYKPARWHFRGFELLTGVTRENWVHVANSWYHDVAPAQALGLSRVWLDRDGTGEHAGAATIQVRSAAQVAGVVDRLFETTGPLAAGSGPVVRTTIAPVALA
jgi:2-haloacid dehalogenase